MLSVVALAKAGTMAVKYAESIVADRKKDVRDLIAQVMQGKMKQNMAKYLVRALVHACVCA